MLNIILDRDTSLNYETSGPLKKAWDFFFVPVLNNLPSFLRNLAKKTGASAKEIIETATSHHAIEILYKDGEPHRVRNPLQRFFHFIWFSTNNPKAVRNRLKLVKREIKNAVKGIIEAGENINIISIASGSARAVVEALDFPEFSNAKIDAVFLDKNPKALEYSKKIVASHNLPKNFSPKWVEDTAGNFSKYFNVRKPNIIETVGLMDYFDDEQVQRFFSQVYEGLTEGGTFITANIADNPERMFVTNFVGWEMIYREPEEFFIFAKKAGFKEQNIKIMLEPLKVHFVMVARK